MKITLNGAEHALQEGTSVAALLDTLGLAEKPAAVEVNRGLVRKSEHPETVLREGDTVEVVTLAGGG